MIRHVTRYVGNVQGVGFRYTTERIARTFEVGGYVRNMPDGSVEMVVEGEPSELEAFGLAVSTEMSRNIREQQSHEAPATGEFDTFGIRF